MAEETSNAGLLKDNLCKKYLRPHRFVTSNPNGTTTNESCVFCCITAALCRKGLVQRLFDQGKTVEEVKDILMSRCQKKLDDWHQNAQGCDSYVVDELDESKFSLLAHDAACA